MGKCIQMQPGHELLNQSGATDNTRGVLSHHINIVFEQKMPKQIYSIHNVQHMDMGLEAQTPDDAYNFWIFSRLLSEI